MCKKIMAIEMAYEIATLSKPSADLLDLVGELPFERTLELFLILRQAGTVRSPVNFIRRAIEENWTPETTRQKTDRRTQNRKEQFFVSRGYTLSEARDRANREGF